MKNLLRFQEALSKKHGYKKLNYSLAVKVRKIYKENIPIGLKLHGDCAQLKSLEGTVFANGYSGIVIGDYGAFIEIPFESIVFDDIKTKEGQEYRQTDSKFNNNVKYWWFTTKDNSDMKLYRQVREVSYADYLPMFYYVSVFEVLI